MTIPTVQPLIVPTVKQLVDNALSTIGWGSVIAFFASFSWFLLKTKGKATDVISKVNSEWNQARQDTQTAAQER